MKVSTFGSAISQYFTMRRTYWFDRVFLPVEDNGLLPGIIERLEGTPARLQWKTQNLPEDAGAAINNEKWSVKKEIGHLGDMEPLWYVRLLQILDDNPHMQVADLTNRKTHDSPHDDKSFVQLVTEFSEGRQKFIERLRSLRADDLDKASVHPRLGTPMKVIDLAYFVAEHDDHHLAQVTCLITG